jgi:ligand-binding sensor domain-containing protein
MKTRHFVTWVVLSSLLLAGCAANSQNLVSPTTGVSTPRAAGIGPGLWPTGMPAPPSPTMTAVSASPGSATSSRKEARPDTLPATIPSTHGVATSRTPGWTTYESINQVRDLAFAPDGTLWAATGGGLVHWDLNAQTYTRYSITARALALAPDGTLWLGLEQGLCRFDGVSCAIYPEAGGLIGYGVLEVAVAPDGIVWVGTAQGVSRFDGDSWQDYPSPVATRDLAITPSGEVWAATAGGIGRYSAADDTWITYAKSHGLPSSNAQVIAAGPDDEVWAYLVWEGVYRFDGTGWQKVEGASGSVFDISFTPDGTPWIATTGGMHYPGGSLFYRDGDRWIDVSPDQGLHSFIAVALGPGGIVAASTQLGLGLYERGEWHLLRDGPISGNVTSVAVTPDGAAWFAFGDHSVQTPGWGLSRFDGQKWDYFLDDAEVNTLAVGPDGTLWAGVGCSVQHSNGISWETVALCEELPAGNVSDIAFTADGGVWVATGIGLARFDGQSWTIYEKLVNSVLAAPDGSLWMSGWEGMQGSFFVARFDGESWTANKVADSFPGGFMVRAVTPDGLVWGIAPQGRVVSFDGQIWTDERSWTFYDIPDGAFSHYTVDLTVAPTGALWLAAEDVVARFDRESAPEEAWTLYTYDYGLPDRYHRAMAFGPGGEIWFGATRFEPTTAEANVER